MDLHSFLSVQPWLLSNGDAEHNASAADGVLRSREKLSASLHVSLVEQQGGGGCGKFFLGATAPDACYLSFLSTESMHDPMQFTFRVGNVFSDSAAPGMNTAELGLDTDGDRIGCCACIACEIDTKRYSLVYSKVQRVVVTEAVVTAAGTAAARIAACLPLSIAPDRFNKPPHVSLLFDHVTLNLYPRSVQPEQEHNHDCSSIQPIYKDHELLVDVLNALCIRTDRQGQPFKKLAQPAATNAAALPLAKESASLSEATVSSTCMYNRLRDYSSVCLSGLECQASLLSLILSAVDEDSLQDNQQQRESSSNTVPESSSFRQIVDLHCTLRHHRKQAASTTVGLLDAASHAMERELKEAIQQISAAGGITQSGLQDSSREQMAHGASDAVARVQALQDSLLALSKGRGYLPLAADLLDVL